MNNTIFSCLIAVVVFQSSPEQIRKQIFGPHDTTHTAKIFHNRTTIFAILSIAKILPAKHHLRPTAAVFDPMTMYDERYIWLVNVGSMIPAVMNRSPSKLADCQVRIIIIDVMNLLSAGKLDNYRAFSPRERTRHMPDSTLA